MPVIKHYDGICVMFVDQDADLKMAESLVLNAKCQRPGVCNAIETLLVHRKIAGDFFETTGRALLDKGVELRCEPGALEAASHLAARHPGRVIPAKPDDFRTEFLDLVLAVKIVDSLEEAVEHTETHGSHHSDAIITANPETAERYLSEIDSATVYW